MSGPTWKHLRVRDVDGVAVVDFVDAGLMFESSLVRELGEELERLAAEHPTHRLILDFREVQYISSTMLGQLVRLQKQIAQLQGQLRLTGLGPVLRDTFRIGRFEPLFEIHESVDEALRAMH